MSHFSSDEVFPRGVLVGAIVLIGFTVLAAGLGRWASRDSLPHGGASAVDSVALRFEDRPDGAVWVRAGDAGDRVVEVFPPGTNGFARGVLRGLARERRASGLGSSTSFELTRWTDGRLTLEDPATRRSIDLGAFGPTNLQVFAEILSAQADS